MRKVSGFLLVSAFLLVCGMPSYNIRNTIYELIYSTNNTVLFSFLHSSGGIFVYNADGPRWTLHHGISSAGTIDRNSIDRRYPFLSIACP